MSLQTVFLRLYFVKTLKSNKNLSLKKYNTESAENVKSVFFVCSTYFSIIEEFIQTGMLQTR